MGAGIAAAGLSAVSWGTMSAIAASWVISPVLGGAVAAGFLALIKAKIQYQDDKIAAARRWVPILVAVMAGAFATYLSVKGLKRIVKIDLEIALLIGLASGFLAWSVTVPWVRRKSEGLENRTKSLKVLFGLAFGHLSRVSELCTWRQRRRQRGRPAGRNCARRRVWRFCLEGNDPDMGDGDRGLWDFVRSVPVWPQADPNGGQPDHQAEPNAGILRRPCRQRSQLLSQAGLGLPVSSTHIAVGAVFGVGFYREWNQDRRRKQKQPSAPARVAAGP